MKVNPKLWRDIAIITLTGLVGAIVNDFVPRFFPSDHWILTGVAVLIILALIKWKE